MCVCVCVCISIKTYAHPQTYMEKRLIVIRKKCRITPWQEK